MVRLVRAESVVRIELLLLSWFWFVIILVESASVVAVSCNRIRTDSSALPTDDDIIILYIWLLQCWYYYDASVCVVHSIPLHCNNTVGRDTDILTPSAAGF